MPRGETKSEISRIKQDTFESLFHEHEASLFRYIRHLAGSSGLVEDIYQEVWLRIAGHINSGKEIRNFKSFIFTIATNIFRDELRRLQIRRFFLGPAVDEEFPDQIWVSSNKPDAFDLSDALETALRKLSTKQRIMFCLSYIEGFKISEISRLMSCAQGTVKATIYKAVQKLRRELHEYNRV